MQLVLRSPRSGSRRPATRALATAIAFLASLAVAPRAGAAGDSGVLDTMFGSGGKVQQPIGTNAQADEGFALALQDDGAIVVVGRTTTKIAAARFSTTGALDATFNTTGILSLPVPSATRAEAHAVLLDGSQRIVMGGFAIVSSHDRFTVVRLLANGTPDPSFNADGNTDGIVTLTTLFGTQDSQARAMALQPDGKIVLAGWTKGANRDAALVRIDAAGALDPTFNVTGKVTSGDGFGVGNDEADAIALQPDGKIVVAGLAFQGNNQNALVARFLANGALDTTFHAPNGFQQIDFGGQDAAAAILLQPDGKIVVAGVGQPGGSSRFAIARLDENGELDPTFGGAGTVTVAISHGTGDQSDARALVLRPHGRILVAGRAAAGATYDFAALELRADGSIDPTLGTDGIVRFDFNTKSDEANGAALQDDGNVVLAGTARAGSNADFGLARLVVTSCGDGVVDAGEECDDDAIGGASCCSVVCEVRPASDVCRPQTGSCDVAETCDGADPTCPPDAVVDAGITCRGAAGDCDVAEACDGVGHACPADLRVGAGTTCRSSAGDCDVAEACDGFSAACPSDVRRPLGFVCRGPAGACDAAEKCDGTSAQCPTDVLSTAGTVCRAAAGDCDVAETCDGLSLACPPDAVKEADTPCRASAGICDVAESCDGGSPACPADQFAPSTTVCREAAGDCDAAETCTGSAAACPADALATAGTVCRAAVDDCDVAESCDGAVASCPADRHRPDRDQDGVCNKVDVCPNVSDPDQTDGDGDGLGDACDPCTNGVALSAALLKIANYATPAGDDTFKLKAKLVFAAAPTLAPATTGAHLVVTDGNAKTLFDAAIPPGAFDGATGTGWKTSVDGTIHTFLSPVAIAGVVNKVKIIVPADRPNVVKILVTGHTGSFATLPVALPLTATFAPDPTAAADGVCGELAFSGPAPDPVCAFDDPPTALTCR
ncbi:MAG TPA: hypothetical protein VFD92_18265 [Candidatus Binatia bacterium]|nr:hypothetical protein [Candidatus Binatia bacterium]